MKKKRIYAVFCVVALMTCSALAAGGVTTKMIEAQYSGITLVVDGTEVTPRDANGNAVEPFAYNGTTYLPVRAVGNALGKSVEWDSSTNTVYVGQRPSASVDLIALPPYQKSGFVSMATGEPLIGGGYFKSFNVAGKEQIVGLNFQTGYGNDGAYALWNLEGNYQTLTLNAGHIDGSSSYDAVIHFYLNGSSDSISYDLSWEALPKSITVPLNGAQSLKIVISSVSGLPSYGLYDIKFS